MALEVQERSPSLLRAIWILNDGTSDRRQCAQPWIRRYQREGLRGRREPLITDRIAAVDQLEPAARARARDSATLLRFRDPLDGFEQDLGFDSCRPFACRRREFRSRRPANERAD